MYSVRLNFETQWVVAARGSGGDAGYEGYRSFYGLEFLEESLRWGVLFKWFTG